MAPLGSPACTLGVSGGGWGGGRQGMGKGREGVARKVGEMGEGRETIVGRPDEKFLCSYFSQENNHFAHIS